jgi:hypothetical protein
LSAEVKRIVNNKNQNELLIQKVIKNKIVDEYLIYNKKFIQFQAKSFNSKYYFITCGNDFKEYQVGNEKLMLFLTSIKIFDATSLLDRNHRAENKDIEKLMVRQINLLRNINDGQLYLGKDFPKNVVSIDDITSFTINQEFSHCAVGLDRGQIILIQGYPNLIDVNEKNIRLRFLTQIESNLHIQNLAFTNSKFSKEINILYATTVDAIYYYRINDKKEEVSELNTDSGAYSDCIAVDDDKLVVASSMNTYIIEYINLERGPSWFFDGKKKYIGYFKNYLTFVIHEEKVYILAVFDRINKFFAYFNNNFNNISALCHDDENIYAFVETD